MNDSKLSGYLVREPYVSVYKKTQDKELKRAVFTIANNIVKGRKIENANFVTCVAFGSQAKIVEENIHKGDKVIIEGHLVSGSYDKDEQKVFTLHLIVDDIEFLNLNNDKETNNNLIDVISVPDVLESLNGLPSPF